MKRTLAYLLLAVVAYGGFLVVTFPAERGLALLQTHFSFKVSGVSGSVWSGRASRVQYQDQEFNRVKWRFKPMSLILAKIEIAVSFDGGGRRGQMDIVLLPDGGLRFSNLTARFPVAELGQQFGLGVVALSGLIDVELDELLVHTGKPQSISGKVFWKGAGVSAPIVQTLGEFEAAFTTENEVMKAVVKDKSGPLQVDGEFELTPGGAYQFNGRLLVRDTQQAMLVQAVPALGVKERDGRVRVTYAGQI